MRCRTVQLFVVVALVAACGAKEKGAGTTVQADPGMATPSAAEKDQAQVVRVPPIAAVTNLDFEGGADAKGFPAGWGGGGLGYLFAVDTSAPHAGKGSFSLKWNRPTAPDSNDWGTLTQCVTGSEWLGKRIQLTGFLKTASVDTGAGLWMRVDSAAKAGTTAFDNMLDRPARGTSDWKSYSVVLDVDKHAIDVCFGVVIMGTGTVWADDLAIRVVGTDVKTTGEKPTP